MKLLTQEAYDGIGHRARTVGLCDADIEDLLYHVGQSLKSPAPPVPRESDFWVGPYQEAGHWEEEMRKRGYEVVSAAAMAPVHIDNGTTFLIHLHFRKP